jgi:hypothetical protein
VVGYRNKDGPTKPSTMTGMLFRQMLDPPLDGRIYALDV